MPSGGKSSPGVLVAGCGSIGRRHLRNLRACGVEKLFVTDPDGDRRGEAAREVEAGEVGSIREAVERGANVVFVTSPSHLHLEMALEAARLGCDLFVEKPLSHEWSGVPELLALCETNKIVTMVGCNMRFHHGPRTLRDVLASGCLGNIASAHLDAGQYLPDWHPSEDYRRGYSANRSAGGGVLLDGIHEIDYALWLFGAVTHVAAGGGHRSALDLDVEDTVDLLLRFDGGLPVTIHLDYIQRSYSRTCKIIGDMGTALWSFGEAVRVYDAETRRWREIPPEPGYEVNAMYVDELKHFLKAVSDRRNPMGSFGEGARALAVALAAGTALADGSTVAIQ